MSDVSGCGIAMPTEPGRDKAEQEDTISDINEEPTDEEQPEVEAVDEDAVDEDELGDIEVLAVIEFEIGDSVVYPHHGAGRVIRKEMKTVLGESREYLTIKILHNEMTVMVPTANAAVAGLRRVIDPETCQKVLGLLQEESTDIPGNWNRRFKHNREKIKTGDVYELAEVVRNLAIRENSKGLSTGEKQMYTRAKKVLCSELMYALELDEEQVDVHITELMVEGAGSAPIAAVAD
jgi:CarD family transcriptional regulator